MPLSHSQVAMELLGELEISHTDFDLVKRALELREEERIFATGIVNQARHRIESLVAYVCFQQPFENESAFSSYLRGKGFETPQQCRSYHEVRGEGARVRFYGGLEFAVDQGEEDDIPF